MTHETDISLTVEDDKVVLDNMNTPLPGFANREGTRLTISPDEVVIERKALYEDKPSVEKFRFASPADVDPETGLLFGAEVVGGEIPYLIIQEWHTGVESDSRLSEFELDYAFNRAKYAIKEMALTPGEISSEDAAAICDAVFPDCQVDLF